MTELVRICAVGLAGGLLALTVRDSRREMALIISLATSVIIAVWVVLSIGDLLGEINNIIAECDVDVKYFAVCIKAVGLSYLSQFTAEILRDGGENAVASKVEAAGKISILLITMPVILSFLRLCVKVVNTI